MKAEEKQRTAEVLTEKSLWMWVGFLLLHIKPLTLGQIYEIGTFTCDIESENLDLRRRIVPSAEMLMRYKSARQMQEIFLICAFRKRWKRWLFRHYILPRLTVAKFKKALDVVTDPCTANFFLTSIIFLRQVNAMTEPSQTIPPGQQSEE